MRKILEKEITYVKGIGPVKADIMDQELGIKTVHDLVLNFPFRYIDKSEVRLIKDMTPNETVQTRGTLISKSVIKGKRQSRLTAVLKDSSGFLELIWFKGIKWINDKLVLNREYYVYGRTSTFKGSMSIAHPEMEAVKPGVHKRSSFEPVYSSTEKLNNLGFDSKARRRILKNIIPKLTAADFPENLPDYILQKLKLIPKYQAVQWLHFPPDSNALSEAKKRLKFEEVLYFQLRILYNKELRKLKIKGHPFLEIGKYFNKFYNEKLSFELTDAQKKVIKEIRADLGSGLQMNRLLQGDVGSGKTIVALFCMLISKDNGYQSVLMAPTEILAQQHFNSITESISGLGLRVAFLSGNVKGKVRNEILRLLKSGDLDILIGTHAVLEKPVQFENLGLAIIDEQHRFGVMQRSKLWLKGKDNPPHVLVMTATPIPRTLAMTIYGDLEVSVIDELPPGRKDIKTVHRTEKYRPQVIEFMHQQIKLGRQIYVVFPLIEESSKLDLENLQQGYDKLLHFFPPPEYKLSVVHGKMKPADKDIEMQRFAQSKTQIMVATTVIEVGVNVPNASVMIIENTERFGLSQLHQLRGRVGRGAEQSYCILMSSYKLSEDARTRISTMVSTNDGFKIAEVDLEIRGPGDIEGTQQSGIMDFKVFNIIFDQDILNKARTIAQRILDKDPYLESAPNLRFKQYLSKMKDGSTHWGRIG
ncbi:MAG: ATP-dependent DNA helicase RecG [Bacteroidia bacterium]|nr:ATP-dependent DNA helicase RecG [Bacteroidia bacterium]